MSEREDSKAIVAVLGVAFMIGAPYFTMWPLVILIAVTLLVRPPWLSR